LVCQEGWPVPHCLTYALFSFRFLGSGGIGSVLFGLCTCYVLSQDYSFPKAFSSMSQPPVNRLSKQELIVLLPVVQGPLRGVLFPLVLLRFGRLSNRAFFSPQASGGLECRLVDGCHMEDGGGSFPFEGLSFFADFFCFFF